jgi:uncharacterized membrane protein YkvA (DUF1232 family)
MGDFGERLRTWAKALKREIGALWFAIRDPGTPWYARVLGLAIVGYALSPIDLIPDFIPVLGYLDDIIILPLGIALLRRLIPAEVLKRARARADAELGGRKLVSRAAAIAVVMTWLAAAALIAVLVFRNPAPPH